MFIPPSREFLTYKAGKWKFTAACDSTVIYPLLVRARTMFEAVSAIPLMPEWRSMLNTELITRSIFGTAAIEGNPMSEQEVSIELSGAASPVHDTTRAQCEIRNLSILYKFLKETKTPEKPLNEDLVKSFHSIITTGLAFEDNIPGHYRNSAVKVGDAAHGGVYTPPRERVDVMNLMRELFLWLHSEETQKTDPLLLAACVHYYLVRIHPFRDGNGRTARFAEAYLLASAGMGLISPMLSNYYYRFKDDYFNVIFETAKSGDMTPFFQFFLTAFYEEMKLIQKEIIPMLKIFMLRDVVDILGKGKKITKRQQALLEILLRNGDNVSLDDLYERAEFSGYYKNVTQSTARRDLKKLTYMDLLIQQDKRYSLNLDYLNT